MGDIQTTQPIKIRDLERIGSVTKSFATTVILQLAEESLLSLDESIERFNTGLQNANEITIRQLCNHTSGLFNYTEDPELLRIFISNPLKKWTPQELIQIAINHGPIAPPGTAVKYNNTGFIVQGIIIEQLTGKPLHKVINERIIKPLELKHTSLPTTAEFNGEFAHGYIVEGNEIIAFTSIDPSSSWAAGGMISNLLDLKRWTKALAVGSLLSSRMQRERLTFVTPPQTPGPFQGPFVKYGLGIEKLGPFLGHEGDIVSYNCSINYFPKHDATFVVLINKNLEENFPSDGATRLFKSLSKVLFPDDVPW